MATIQEARQILTQQQQQMEQQRKSIQKTKLRELSKSELLKQTIRRKEQRKGEGVLLQKQKLKVLAGIKKYEKEVLQPYEKQVIKGEKEYARQKKEYDKQKAEYDRQVRYNQAINTVQKFIWKGKVHLLAMYGEGDERKIARDYLKRKRLAKEHDVLVAAKMKGVEITGTFQPPKIDFAEWQARVKVQAPGTYDPVTKSYIDSQGRGMTIVKDTTLPAGTKIIGQPSIPAFLQPQPISPGLQALRLGISPVSPVLQALGITSTPKFEHPKLSSIGQQQFETYKGAGYTSTQARALVLEGDRLKMTLSPKGAEQFLQQQKLQAAQPLPSFGKQFSFTSLAVTSPVVPAFLQPQYKTPEQKQFFETVTKPHLDETQRYKDLGYITSEAQKLATASLREGGITFTPQEAQRIIIKDLPVGARYGRIAGQKIQEWGKEGWEKAKEKGAEVYEKVTPILEYKIPVVAGLPSAYITPGQVLASPLKGLEVVAESSAAGWEEIHSKTMAKLPPEFQLSKVVIGKQDEYKKLIEDLSKGKITRSEFKIKIEGITIPYTSEQFGKGVETAITLGGYAALASTPAGWTPLLVSETALAQQEFAHPEKEAKRIVDKEWGVYEKEVIKSRKDLEEGYELIDVKTKKEFYIERMPQVIANVKSGAVGRGLVSVGLMGGGGVWKVGKEVKKFVPKKDVYIEGMKMSQKQYIKHLESVAKGKKLEKDLWKLKAERERGIVATREPVFKIGPEEGVSIEKIGSVEMITFADDLFNLGIYKTKKEALHFVKDITRTTTRTRFPPSRVEAKAIGFPDIPKELIPIQDVYTISKAIKFKGQDRIIQWTYQLGSKGRPINVGLQIVKVPKGSKYAEIMVYEKGRVSKFLKDGPVWRRTDKFVSDIGKIKDIKVDKDFLRRHKSKLRRVEFKKGRVTKREIDEGWGIMPTKSKLKELYKIGKRVEEQDILEIIRPIGVRPRLEIISGEKVVGALGVVEKVKAVEMFGVSVPKTDVFKISKLPEIKKPIIKTPLDVHFPSEADKLITKQVVKLEKPLKLIAPVVKVPRAVPKPFIPELKELPSMVGGTGPVTSIYAGKMMYERTTDLGIGMPGVLVKEITPAMDKIIDKVYVKPIIDITPISFVKPREALKPVEVLRPLEVLKPIEMLKPIEVLKPKELLRQREALKQRELLKQKLLLRPSEALRPVEKVVVRPKPRPRPEPPRPKPKMKIIPIVLPRRRKRFMPPLKKKPPIKKGYGIEIRRKGKWERVFLPHSFATMEGAEAKAMSMVQKEAAASYKIIKSKKPAKKSKIKPSALQKFMFRPGKEPGVMVQKKLLRITTPGEVKEISLVGAAARRKKPRNVLTLTPGILKPKTKKKIKKKKKK